MTSTVESRQPFEFVFPLPGLAQRLLLTLSAPLLAVALLLLFKALPRSEPGTTDFFATLALVLMAAGALTFLGRLAFPRAQSCARLEIQHERILFRPGSVLRLIGEQNREMRIEAEATEILLCRSYSQGLFQGTRIIVRGPISIEREIKIDDLVTLSARQFRRLADGIASATGLPVRGVLRRYPVNGTFEETPWAPTQHAAWQSLLGVVLATLPYSGGLIIGPLSPSLSVMILTGLALWLLFTFAASQIARRDHSKNELSKANLLVTVFTFTGGYALSIVITLFIVKPH